MTGIGAERKLIFEVSCFRSCPESVIQQRAREMIGWYSNEEAPFQSVAALADWHRLCDDFEHGTRPRPYRVPTRFRPDWWQASAGWQPDRRHDGHLAIKPKAARAANRT